MADRLITLSEHEKSQVRQALQQARLLQSEIRRAKQAGLPVDDLEQELNDLTARLQKIHRVYVEG